MAKSKTRQYPMQNGEKLTCREVRPVLVQVLMGEVEEKWRTDGKMIDKPRFQVDYGGAEVLGDNPWIDHFVDEEKGVNSLDVPDDPRKTAINWALWKQYETDSTALEEAKAEAQVKLLITKGIVCEVPPLEEWADLIAPMEIEEDEDERRFQWLWFVHIPPADKMVVHQFILLLSAEGLVSEAQIAKFCATVRPSVGRAIRAQFDNALAELERALDEEESRADAEDSEEGVEGQ